MKRWYCLKKPTVEDPDGLYGVFYVEETTIHHLKSGVRMLGPFDTEAEAEAAVLKNPRPTVVP